MTTPTNPKSTNPPRTQPSEEQIAIAAAVGNIPSGLFIVTAQDTAQEKDKAGGVIDGFLASWVQQVSFKPMLVSLCIKPGRPAYDHIKAGSVFCINVVGDHETKYLKHFWSGFDAAKDPFAEIPHTITNDGAVVIDAAKSAIVVRLKETVTPGDHELVIAEVLSSIVNNTEATPKTHMRKSGLDY